MSHPTHLVEIAAPAKACAPEPQARGSFRIAVHPLLRNVGLTGATSLVVAIASMILISLVGRILGPVLLGEYLLVRRIASWLQSFVALPSGIALPRYVAASVDKPRSTRQAYFVGALATGCGLAFLLGAAILLWKGPASRWMFGSAELAPLAFPLGLLLVGLAAHVCVFGFYQGILSMRRACALQLCNLAIVPILAVVLLARKHSIPAIVEATGFSMVVLAFLFSIPILRRARLFDVTRRALQGAPELLTFGLSRAFGDFGLQALLSLPAVIAARWLPMRSVSYLLLGGSFLALVSAATLPLGIILLSEVTRSLAKGRTPRLSEQLAHFIAALIESSVFASLQMLVFAGPIVGIWVGAGFAPATRVVQIFILAVPFYFVYAGLRSVVDAAALKAHNTRNILISLAVFFLGVGTMRFPVVRDHLLEAVALSVVMAMCVLSLLTLRTIRQLLEVRVRWARFFPGVSIATALGACSFLLHRALGFQLNPIALLCYEGLLSAVYLLALWRIRSSWVHFLVKSMLPARSFDSPAVGL